MTPDPFRDSTLSNVREQPSRVRYGVLALTFSLGGITFMDRVCISMTAPQMKRELALTDFQMGLVFSAFTLAYALFEIPTGWWGDRVGTRRVLTRIVLWWSAFTVATAAASSFFYLLTVRFLFGAGEAGAFPSVASTHQRWFPATERGRVQSLFFTGAFLGGSLTPLLVTALLTLAHWRMVFVAFGLIGFVWSAVWYRWFRDDPALHHGVSQSELDHIRSGQEPRQEQVWPAPKWRTLLGSRNLLALSLMYFALGYGGYFFVTWFPSYLARERGFSGTELSLLAGMPMALSILTIPAGGLVSDSVASRRGLRVGRSAVGGLGLATAGLLMLAGTAARHGLLSAVLISLAYAAANFTLGACWGACLDIAGQQSGTVSACMNTAGQLGGALSPVLLATMLERSYSWSVPLYQTGVIYLLGAACWWLVDSRKSIGSGHGQENPVSPGRQMTHGLTAG